MSRARAPVTAAARSRTADALERLDRSLREAHVMDRNGYPYLVHPLIDGIPRADADLLRAWTDWAAAQKDVLAEATVLVAPEAMGLPLVATLSLATGLPYLVVRKRQYGLPGEIVAYGETGYGEAALHVNAIEADDRVLLVDDVLSTGGTLTAIAGVLDERDAEVVGALVFLDKGRVRSVLEERLGAPVRAMRTIAITDGKVQIVADPL